MLCILLELEEIQAYIDAFKYGAPLMLEVELVSDLILCILFWVEWYSVTFAQYIVRIQRVFQISKPRFMTQNKVWPKIWLSNFRL